MGQCLAKLKLNNKQTNSDDDEALLPSTNYDEGTEGETWQDYLAFLGRAEFADNPFEATECKGNRHCPEDIIVVSPREFSKSKDIYSAAGLAGSHTSQNEATVQQISTSKSDNGENVLIKESQDKF